MERWDLVRTERLALADTLDTLTPEQWHAPSLCEGWSVRDVAVHVMIGPTSRVRDVVGAIARGRGSIDRAMQVMVDDRSELSTDEVIALVREHADSQFTPPTMDWRSPLTDMVIHREDIAVPLGLRIDHVEGALPIALDLLVSSAGRRGFTPGRLPSLRYRATDVDWAHGSGPDVRGRAIALALTMTGRDALVDELVGEGVPDLEAWIRRWR